MDAVFQRIKTEVLKEINPESDITETELEELFDKVFLELTDISVSASDADKAQRVFLLS